MVFMTREAGAGGGGEGRWVRGGRRREGRRREVGRGERKFY